MDAATSEAPEELVREHAALRRVATLVAREPPPIEVFDAARDVLERARRQLDEGLAELRDPARGIHPSVLTDRGLEPALDALVQHAPVPAELRLDVPGRLDAAIEAAAYFVVSEALTNVAKYADASAVTVDVSVEAQTVVVTVADDGAGGARPESGTGLRGLVDRVEAVGGLLEIHSPPGDGTRLCARLPTNVLGSLNGG